MVLMQPEVLGYDVLFHSWKGQLPAMLTAKETLLPTLDRLYKNLVPSTIFLLRKSLKECSPTMDNNIVSSLFKIINCFFKPYEMNVGEGEKGPEKEELDHLHNCVE